MFWPFDEPMPSQNVWFSATVLALMMSGIGIAALKYLIPFFNLNPDLIRGGFDSRFDVSPIGAVSVVIFLSIINSAVEELHFRAWLDREVSRIAGNLTGISMSAIAFGSMHVLIFLGLSGFPPLLVVFAGIALAAAGVVWSLIMRKNGGIHAAWWSHALTDAVLLTWGLNWLGYV